jgi:hypothetical protein
MSMDELANVKGRGWEDIDVSGKTCFVSAYQGTRADSTLALSENTMTIREVFYCIHKPPV